MKAKRRYWLTIFLPIGVCWEIGDGFMRTRKTATGKICMSTRFFEGTAESWLAPARSLSAIRYRLTTTKTPTAIRAEMAGGAL
jgi:hypothetical protein